MSEQDNVLVFSFEK